MMSKIKKTEMDKEQTIIMSGNYASAWGAKCSRVKVVSAYPITPQTTVVEKLADFVEGGELDARYIKVESEHSVMASLVGSSMTGARSFTATSGQGLLYMTEMLHWVSSSRLPIVTTIASRGIAPPWNIWAEYTDILSVRDCGWIIQFASTHQEIFDSILMGYKIAENEGVMLPYFIVYGGFTQSHTSKPVRIPPQKDIDSFLPSPPEKGWSHLNLDPENPITHGNLLMPQQEYLDFRFLIHDAMMKSKKVIQKTITEFKKSFKRNYSGLTENYKCKDADVVLISYGALAEQSKIAVDELRKQGKKVGLFKLRYIRPFPNEELEELFNSGVKAIGIADQGTAFGNPTGGPISTEVMSLLRLSGKKIKVLPYVWGLGGRDVTVDEQIHVFNQLITLKNKNQYPTDDTFQHGTVWMGLKTGV
ncbi:MAG: pyruvate ferredoxin oxidoreductase [Desulfobacteraceae bacterium]|nr:MAG: pyruvate ferredoxin oxidoreductase [Desulfobacteraceae bacterium]